MANCYPDDFLRMIRNQIPIEKVIITMLNLEVRRTSKWLRCRCPMCHNFHTATNPKTNLARCFDCKQNFNPIDLVSGGLKMYQNRRDKNVQGEDAIHRVFSGESHFCQSFTTSFMR